MNCPKCNEAMDDAIVGGYDACYIQTHFICIDCKIRYVVHHDKDPITLEQFRIENNIKN